MEEKIVSIPTKKNSIKSNLMMFLLFITLIICCVLTFGFLWLGGYAKQVVCNSVLNDSYIYEKIGCSKVKTISSSDSKFPLVTLNPEDIGNQAVISEEDLVTGVVEEVNGGVVGIGVTGEGSSQDQLIGTGFLISDKGLLVTNRHVVADEVMSYYAMFKDQKTPIQIDSKNIFRDPVNDIALIKIDPKMLPSIAKVIPIGDSDIIKEGQTVIAIGNPLGTYTGTITKGIISGLNREVTITKGFFDNQSEIFEDVIQTDAAINPGNSGGPLLNIKGEVIGVNFATIEGASNMSFALPINRIKQRIAEIEQYNKFKIPYLGVQYQTRMITIAGESLLGAQIVSVIAGSPAATAGLQAGDVIVEFDGQDLDKKTLSAMIQTKKIGAEIIVSVVRNKQTQDFKVTIGEK